MKPFLKWAGNKFRIVEAIQARLPKGKRLVEPFVGSAAVFLNTDYPQALLCDANPDLINLYALLKDNTDDLIYTARQWFTPDYNQAEAYYGLRSRFNRETDLMEKAALFIYLNRHGYNGLCRYNQSGGFNVPFGRYRQPYFPERELQEVAVRLASAQLKCQGFEQTFAQLEPGDVVYCDPPYVPLSPSSNFTSYSAAGFSADEQSLLARLAKQAALSGVTVVISNHDTDYTRELYQSAICETLPVHRFISAKSSSRHPVNEVMARFAAKNPTKEKATEYWCR